MNKNNRKKLNNKGFTLIELLAVVVILAVVMGIAMTSVLSSMNKSRGGALQDSAMIIANAFNQKYTESLVGGVPNNVFGDVLDVTGADGNVTNGGYNFQSSAIYLISSKLANTFNITTSGYSLSDNTAAINGTTAQKYSTVSFDASTGRFVVCMVANPAGSYFVDNYKLVKPADAGAEVKGVQVSNVTFEFGQVVACSDGSKSWK